MSWQLDLLGYLAPPNGRRSSAARRAHPSRRAHHCRRRLPDPASPQPATSTRDPRLARETAVLEGDHRPGVQERARQRAVVGLIGLAWCAGRIPRRAASADAAVVFGSLSTVDRFRTAEAEALSRYNTVCSYVIETSIYLPGGRKIRAAGILRTDLTHQPLIFLASCETASPDPNLPDQIFGFAAAFRLAGASAQRSLRRCSPSCGSRQFWWQRGFTTK